MAYKYVYKTYERNEMKKKTTNKFISRCLTSWVDSTVEHLYTAKMQFFVKQNVDKTLDMDTCVVRTLNTPRINEWQNYR